MSLTRGLVLDVANQLGGAMPGVVTLKDWSRYKNDGAMTNVTWIQLPTGLWVPVFNGTSSVIGCGNDESVRITQTISLELWIRTSDTTGTLTYILGKCQNANRRSYLLYMTPTDGFGSFYISSDGAGANRAYRVTATAINDGQWHHLVAVYIPSTNQDIYLDGALNNGALTGGIQANIYDNATDPLTLGWATWGGTPNYWDGEIVMAHIYNYALTPAQIRAKYHSSKWLFGVAS